MEFERRKDGRLEINIAIEEIRCAFDEMEHQPYKVSYREVEGEEYLEVSFVTPDIAALYEDVLEELRYWTLWEIRTRQKPNSSRLIRLVTEMLPPQISLRRNPSIFSNSKTVVVRPDGRYTRDDFAEAATRFQAATGYRLEVSES